MSRKKDFSVLLLSACGHTGRLGAEKRQGPVEFPWGSPIQLAKDKLLIPVKVKFDEYYLKNRSFCFDFKILLMTFIKVVKRKCKIISFCSATVIRKKMNRQKMA